MTAPLITIFVRHSAGCKYRGDEFEKRCHCRKHLRWTQHGKQHRRKANTRSWVAAEEVKRRLEDQLSGKMPEPTPETSTRTLAEAVRLFCESKKTQGIVKKVQGQYAHDLGKLEAFSAANGLFTPAQALTVDNLIAWRSTWCKTSPASSTQKVIQQRLKAFLKFSYHAGWINRIPQLSPIKLESPETQPLTEDEYKAVLKAARKATRSEVRTLIQLMRWSGLAIRDAALLKRSDIVVDGDTYRIIRERTKTGTPLYIPIPPDIGREVIAVLNGNPKYVFWNKQTAESSEYSAASQWGTRIAEIFKAAGIESEGHMISHRLRATFAVDLLQKGVPLEHVSKLLGHRSVSTTERHYAKWVKGRQVLLDNLVSATWGKRKS